MKNPRKHRCCSRLAMRASDRENFFPTQEFIMKNLWQRAERNALVEHMLEFHIATRDCVADHHKIGATQSRVAMRLRCRPPQDRGAASDFVPRTAARGGYQAKLRN